MTARESDGLPALKDAGTVTCTDGNANASPELEVSNTTLEVTTDRGTTVTRLLTPRARSVARDVFGCDTYPQMGSHPGLAARLAPVSSMR